MPKEELLRKTLKFRLYPAPAVRDKIDWTMSTCCFLYNALLEQRIFAYRRRGVSLGRFTQSRELPGLKEELPFFKDIYAQVLCDVVNRLDLAYQAFFRRLKRGEKAGFPKFHPSRLYNSFTYTQGGFWIEGNRLRLSKIGEISMRMRQKIKGKVKTCSIVRQNNNYYVCFSCVVEPDYVKPTYRSVGVDLGITHLAITSDGTFYDAPKYLRKSEYLLKRLSRVVSRRKKGSMRRRAAVRSLAKKHEYIANQRNDMAHKISRDLVNKYDFIAFENLNIQGMVKNNHLSKSISDAAWRRIIDYTSYKAKHAGKEIVEVDPKNTSQLCSNCGLIVKKELKERTHKCACGYEDHRDINAARNILMRGLSQIGMKEAAAASE